MTKIGRKLSPENINRMKQIIEYRKSGITQKEIGKYFNLSQERISAILLQAEYFHQSILNKFSIDQYSIKTSKNNKQK